ncbi:uncharacterized protein EI97DRAFT_29443 [Westerdykella ornata]|uniref:Sister chromatid cohesion protein Ctf8 n=1 Tax=Westerdykella ornata TaxID=318751 RepID=A0A6A6JZD6_WESOR|nr:uncharacterized protein EI97DRAFT_29443 [Westerdykella ornata]KAF2281443.1 hypothetical protein EI97DRAFT_29443 [Westerdykella ornata]
MPTIPLRLSRPRPSTPTSTPTNPLPSILHTPSGLALLELQGTIRFPAPEHGPSTSSPPSNPSSSTPLAPSTSSTLVGKLVFPLYNPDVNGENDTKWMKRVYFYVGENQRLQGEVRRLAKPFAVIRKVEGREGVGEVEGKGDVLMGDGDADGEKEVVEVRDELEIVEIVRFKIVFSSRPEPVSAGEG